MKTLFIICCFLLSNSLVAQKSRSDTNNIHIKAIRQVLETQQDAWNNFNLEGFMEGYWKNDSLQFYGSNGITNGWQKTLNNYKKGYPSQAHTGRLQFTLKSIMPIEKQSYYVMGSYHLTRSVGNAEGDFLLVLKKIDGAWKIIADMSN
ncbi:YybH family protein [Bizionia sediminis]|uniref:YybH family protein n=1 Tax=Bizionia sediminis TaxID=1737064 RepID=A0ABW5KQK5_9FLAO